MSWNYDANNIGKSTASQRLNAVRLLVGDTDTNDQQVQDEEIAFALSESNSNVYRAASWVARSLSSKYSRQIDTQLDGAISAKYSDLAKQYSALADNLEYQAKKAGANVGILAGGISKTAIDGVRANTDRVEPSFRRDRFRNPPSYSGDDYGSDYD